MISAPFAGPAAPALPAVSAMQPDPTSSLADGPVADGAAGAGAAFVDALAVVAHRPAPAALTSPAIPTPLVFAPDAMPFIDTAATPATPSHGANRLPSLRVSSGSKFASTPPGPVGATATPAFTADLPAMDVTLPTIPSDPDPLSKHPSSKAPDDPHHSASVLSTVGEKLAAKGVRLPVTAKPAIFAAAASSPPTDLDPPASAPIADKTILTSAVPGQSPRSSQSRGASRSPGLAAPAVEETEDQAPPTLTNANPMPHTATKTLEDYSPVPRQTGAETKALLAAAVLGPPSALQEPAMRPTPIDGAPVPALDPILRPAPDPTRPVSDHELPPPAIHPLPVSAAAPAQLLHSPVVPLPPPTARPDTAAAIAPSPVQTVAVTGAFGERIGLSIAHHVAQGQDQLTIRLDPKELGRIQISLAFDEQSGALRAVVAAEHSSVLEAIRRDSPELTRALSAAGLTTDGATLQFDNGGNSSPRGQSAPGAGHDHRQGHGQRPNDGARWVDAAASGPIDSPRDAIRGRPSRGRLDLIA